MNHAVEQVVGRLRTMSAQDRDWLLGQLSAEERRRVLTALVGNGSAVNGEGREKTRPGNSTSNATNGAHDPELAALAAASASDVADLLSKENDWTIVVLLQHREWPWAEEYLQSLPPFRLKALRELANELGETIRPKVKETVARIIGRQLRPHVADGTGKRSVFDVMLERAQISPSFAERPGSTE
jgi:hypothetical protein